MRLSGDQVSGLMPAGSGNIHVEIDHRIFLMVILTLPLIEEGQLLVSGERM